MNFAQNIKQLRTEANLSQQDVADKVGLARATYSHLEMARREPNLSEIRTIAKFYEVSPSELIDSVMHQSNVQVSPRMFNNNDIEIAPRDIDPQFKPEKLREVLLYLLEKVGAKPNVGETVLYKLLYFIDFDYYEKYGKSITGLTYIRNHYGPTPALTFKEVVQGLEDSGELEIVTTKFFNNTQRKYLPTISVKLEELSAKELDHINDELARLSDKTATELSDLSHYDTPWVVTKQGKPIDYRYVFYRTKQTAVTEPEDEL